MPSKHLRPDGSGGFYVSEDSSIFGNAIALALLYLVGVVVIVCLVGVMVVVFGGMFIKPDERTITCPTQWSKLPVAEREAYIQSYYSDTGFVRQTTMSGFDSDAESSYVQRCMGKNPSLPATPDQKSALVKKNCEDEWLAQPTTTRESYIKDFLQKKPFYGGANNEQFAREDYVEKCRERK